MTFNKLLKRMELSAEVVAKETGVSVRMFQYLFSRGTIPYVLVFRLSKLSGIPIGELIPEYTAMAWEETFLDRVATRGKRGRKAQSSTEPIATIPPKEKTLKERVDAAPDFPRETSAPVPTPKKEVPTPKKEAPKQTRKGKSIAEIMASGGGAEQPATNGADPDFSKVDDSLFDTSMGGNPLKQR